VMSRLRTKVVTENPPSPPATLGCSAAIGHTSPRASQRPSSSASRDELARERAPAEESRDVSDALPELPVRGREPDLLPACRSLRGLLDDTVVRAPDDHTDEPHLAELTISSGRRPVEHHDDTSLLLLSPCRTELDELVA
jgi:hypothetical protein